MREFTLLKGERDGKQRGGVDGAALQIPVAEECAIMNAGTAFSLRFLFVIHRACSLRLLSLLPVVLLLNNTDRRLATIIVSSI